MRITVELRTEITNEETTERRIEVEAEEIDLYDTLHLIQTILLFDAPKATTEPAPTPNA